MVTRKRLLPDVIGADITNLDAGELAILTNSEVIAINQAAIPPKAVSASGQQQVWYSKQADGSFAVGLFNFGAASAQVTVQFGAVGAGSAMKVRDLVTHIDLGQSSGSCAASSTPEVRRGIGQPAASNWCRRLQCSR